MDQMIIKFQKGTTAKPATLSCIRSDGSMTWTKLHPGMESHDLAHFVIETELEFTDAFYGLLARGFDIGDFELPREERPEALIPSNLPVQAQQTEHIVNLLQINFFNTDEDLDFINTLKSILMENNIDFPEALDQKKLVRINSKFMDLLSKWNTLDEGKTLELVFETGIIRIY